MITKIISVKTSRGKYKVYHKTFNDSLHFENWCLATMRYGTKIIGTTEDTPEEKVNDFYTVKWKKPQRKKQSN